MAKAEATVREPVGMIKCGELRLPEMQRRHNERSIRVRKLIEALFRGYPCGAILLRETDEAGPLQELSGQQRKNLGQSARLVLDGR
jgi:hypothetical protein